MILLISLLIPKDGTGTAFAQESEPVLTETEPESAPASAEAGEQGASDEAYDIEVVPLERAGVELYLKCIKTEGMQPQNICAAAEKIISLTAQEKIDVLGWSWETVTGSRFVAAHPELVNRFVMYAPILCGIGAYEVEEPFHHNTWEHAADDFQRTEDGAFDYSVVDPVMIEMFCSSCWRCDGESSPNGGRRDLCVEDTQLLIDLEKIHVPTLMICGGEDPYLNYDLVNASLEMLPEGSEPEIIEGRSHVVFYEEPYYRDFQERLIRFWMYRKAGMGLPLKAKDFLIVFRYPPDGPFPLSNLFISA